MEKLNKLDITPRKAKKNQSSPKRAKVFCQIPKTNIKSTILKFMLPKFTLRILNRYIKKKYLNIYLMSFDTDIQC